jgi:hypothetical protein
MQRVEEYPGIEVSNRLACNTLKPVDSWTGRFSDRKSFKELTPRHAQLRKTGASTTHPRTVGTQHSLRVNNLISWSESKGLMADGRGQ